MSLTDSFPRVTSFKTPEAFRNYTMGLGLEIPCDDAILKGPSSPLAWPVPDVQLNGKRILNRYAVQPMEGWDATTTGAITEQVIRRWRRFGQSGAKLIWGGEAMAVSPDGRANPNQLIINDANRRGLAQLVVELVDAHYQRFPGEPAPVIGFQLTHSGRFCRPTSTKGPQPRVAYRHPLLDKKVGVSNDDAVMSDQEIERLIQRYIEAARIAREAGADFVDIKHCHGYLLHEFLSAFRRPGKFGGSFENRTRILREIVAGIRADGNPIEVAVRLSAFDTVPFKPDPGKSKPGTLGPGIAEDFAPCLPYEFGFGLKPNNPLEWDLTEPMRFLELCIALGVKLVNLSAGSPYYNPHVQRPAAYPPSDGYLPPEDPLAGVARQMQVVRELKKQVGARLVVIGSGYSYLQEFLPLVAQAALRANWTDVVGTGRTVLSYPEIFADALAKGQLQTKQICRTFSDCTTAPRNGLRSGCYPLDPYYAKSPEADRLKELKREARSSNPESVSKLISPGS